MALPHGMVTLLLTEVADSARRWDDDAVAAAAVMAALDEIVGAVVARHDGHLVKPRGEGDAHFIVFADPANAVAAAAALLLNATRGVRGEVVDLRVSVHSGPAELRDGDYFGSTVNRGARLRAAAYPGQALASGAVAASVADPPPGVTFRPLGQHFLRDLARPIDVWQIQIDEFPSEFPPLASLGAPSHGLPLPLSSFVGRDDELAALVEHLKPGATFVLHGPPGVGKSRLALEAAALYHEGRGGGASVGDDGRAALVILDDVDHDPSGALETAARVTRDRPDTAVIITSRRPIGESGYRVEALATDETGRLLTERGDFIRPGWSNDRDAVCAAAAGLCGLPLAIELAGGRAGLLSPAQLAERLSSRPLSVLARTAETTPRRHRSWLDSVAWAPPADVDRAIPLVALALEMPR